MLTKTDQLDPDRVDEKAAEIIKRLEWKDPWFAISSVARQGLDKLVGRIMTHLEEVD